LKKYLKVSGAGKMFNGIPNFTKKKFNRNIIRKQ